MGSIRTSGSTSRAEKTPPVASAALAKRRNVKKTPENGHGGVHGADRQSTYFLATPEGALDCHFSRCYHCLCCSRSQQRQRFLYPRPWHERSGQFPLLGIVPFGLSGCTGAPVYPTDCRPDHGCENTKNVMSPVRIREIVPADETHNQHHATQFRHVPRSCRPRVQQNPHRVG